MEKSAGSYDFGGIEGTGSELYRLEEQALAAIDLERALWSRAGLRKDMRVLDLACGPGVISRELARVASSGEVIGIDLSDELLKVANELNRQEGTGNLSFRKGDVYELDVEESSIDFIYTRFFFQHLQYPEKALENIARALKPGGILCITDIDDGFLSLYPEPAFFAPFIQKAAEWQEAQGGDRYIGRKLGFYLEGAKMEEVAVDAFTVSSAEMGLEKFLDIAVGFRKDQMLDANAYTIEKELTDIYAVLDEPKTRGFLSIFTAVAKKPHA